MPHELVVKHHGHIAHRLMHHPTGCGNLHGHTYHFQFSFDVLDIDPVTGMGADFSELKKIVRKLVDKWDHGCLLNRKDPVFELLIQRSSLDQSKIIGFDGEPTAEAMAKELWLGVAHELHSNHISGVTIRSVDVWETDVNCATYRS